MARKANRKTSGKLTFHVHSSPHCILPVLPGASNAAQTAFAVIQTVLWRSCDVCSFKHRRRRPREECNYIVQFVVRLRQGDVVQPIKIMKSSITQLKMNQRHAYQG